MERIELPSSPGGEQNVLQKLGITLTASRHSSERKLHVTEHVIETNIIKRIIQKKNPTVHTTRKIKA